MWDCTIERIREGAEPRVMTVAQPAAVASSAAMSFVSIPPVPSDDPNVAVLTRYAVENDFDIRTLNRCSPSLLELTHLPGFLNIPHHSHSTSTRHFSRIVFVQALDVRQ